MLHSQSLSWFDWFNRSFLVANADEWLPSKPTTQRRNSAVCVLVPIAIRHRFHGALPHHHRDERHSKHIITLIIHPSKHYQYTSSSLVDALHKIISYHNQIKKSVYIHNKKNNSKGAVAFADGMLYCLEEGSGDCFLVEATSEGYKEVSRFKLDPQTTQRNPQGRIWTHPVICNGKLYLRDQEIICCYEIKE